jgi:hypothetical protein
MFGVGYQLDASGEPRPRQRPMSRTSNVTGYELTTLFGKTILNSNRSESSSPGSLEYRQGLWCIVDVSGSFIHEDEHIQSRRNSVAAQLCATRAFFATASHYRPALVRTSRPRRSTMFRKTARATDYRDIMFILTLCITHTVPPIRNNAANAV